MTQGTVIIFDIGPNTLVLDGNDKSFFQRSKEFITRVIERKIITLDKEPLALFLMGCENAGISCVNFKFEIPSWNMIRNLPCEPTENTADWFESLTYAVNLFTTKNIDCKTEIINKRIILLTNFMTASSITEDKKEKIKNQLVNENFQVDVIGCDLFEEPCTDSDKNLAKIIVNDTNGVNILFDDAMRQLNFYKKKHVAGNPWLVDLCIGPNINIPISSYIRTQKETPLKTWKEAIRDPLTNRASTVLRVNKKKLYINAENKVVNNKDIVKGVHYGGTIIPLLSLDVNFNYIAESKSLNIYCFTSASNLKWENLNYDSLSYIFGRKDDKNACNTIRCLAECLMARNLIAIARGLKKKNCAPRMYALMPVKENKSLSMVGICYKEEIKHMIFPQTECKKFTCSREQIDAFKDLIKAMNLNTDELEGSEAFEFSKVPSPYAQYAYDSIVFRANNPDKPLPKPRDDIINLFQVPTLIKMRVTELIEKLKSLFVLNKINANQIDNSEAMVVTDDVENIKTESIEYIESKSIGTVNPINDYNLLLSLGRPLNTISQEMSNAIETLFNSNSDQHKCKAIDAMLFFRAESVKDNPIFYNKWLKGFKMELIDRKKDDIIKLIEEKEMDFILNNENELSELKSVDNEMCKMDTCNLIDVAISSEVTDFFDNM
ncbi:PREDICTED: X-ray repair cross-complementing protein 5-like [Papilio xuthus]|uniref:X-ray repair cross-complementing protein 5-like n=1 Tax=Papilio xuthus TaxID=66420 RepID=A0AAJ7EJI7_PAPXU|nr:PREDICTED: X-ray repair cross-complementing protein 5-like [Papilio xuthus]